MNLLSFFKISHFSLSHLLVVLILFVLVYLGIFLLRDRALKDPLMNSRPEREPDSP
jgi:CHASE2 domain-containing sensor protein